LTPEVRLKKIEVKKTQVQYSLKTKRRAKKVIGWLSALEQRQNTSEFTKNSRKTCFFFL